MKTRKRYVVCIRNEGHEESLELRKIYETLDDATAEKDGMLRVVDEDEDYLYPAAWFRRIDAAELWDGRRLHLTNDEWPILPGERRVRFGCGALAGVAIGVSIMFEEATSARTTVLLCVGLAVVFGLAAALFGARFWSWLGVWRWWR